MKFLFPCLALLFFHGCSPKPVPTNVASAAPLRASTVEQQSKAAAYVTAASEAAVPLEESPNKAAIQGSLSTALTFLPIPLEAHLQEARTLELAALGGDLMRAQEGWAKERANGSALSLRIKDLESKVEQERAAAASELQKQLDRAQQEADRKQQAIITYIVFGAATLCIIGAFLVGNLASVVPIFGPKAALSLGIAGGVLFALGMGLRVVEHMMAIHPYIFWGSLLGSSLLLAGGAALVYSNHHHHVNDPSKGIPS